MGTVSTTCVGEVMACAMMTTWGVVWGIGLWFVVCGVCGVCCLVFVVCFVVCCLVFVLLFNVLAAQRQHFAIVVVQERLQHRVKFRV